MKRSQLKALIREVIEEVTMKTWNVSLDRPGAGWSEIVKAPTREKAIKIAHSKHRSEPAPDTVYEVPADFGQKKPQAKNKMPTYVHVDAEVKEATNIDGFEQDYIEGVETGTYNGAVYKRVTK